MVEAFRFTNELEDQFDVINTLNDYLALGQKFDNPPQVKLSLLSSTPNEIVGAQSVAASTAIQCYSPGIAIMKPRDKEWELGVAESTLDSGHLTTRQHTHYTLQLIGISRRTIHDVFHAFPFYNTEQQSQRYTEASEGNFLVPNNLTPEQKAKYLETANDMNKAYFELLQELRPFVGERLAPTHGKRENYQDTVTKYCQEIARYVLPIAQHSNLFYTINELTLIRMFYASKQDGFNDEARFVIANAIYEIYKVDSSILNELRNPPECYEREVLQQGSPEDILRWRQEFDNTLGDTNSKLLTNLQNEREILIQTLRFTFPEIASYSEEEILDALFNPQHNSHLANVFNTGIHDNFTMMLNQINIKFITLLSHAGDSQRQRHRTTPGVSQSVDKNYIGLPDYFVPKVIAENEALKAKYDVLMLKIYDCINALIDMGVPLDTATYLVPNAHNIRIVESGSLFNFLHRWKQRLCFLAQEEIFYATLDQAMQVVDVFPESRPAVLAPCGLRMAAKTRPYCPEGGRFCGVPVWNYPIEDYGRYRVI